MNTGPALRGSLSLFHQTWQRLLRLVRSQSQSYRPPPPQAHPQNSPIVSSMQIKTVRVKNYKRFFDSGTIEFGPGFNVLVGQNDSGKTALVEALSLRSGSNSHRSLRTIPNPGDSPDPVSRIEMSVHLGGAEVRRALAAHGQVWVKTQQGTGAAAAEAIRQALTLGTTIEFEYVHGTQFEVLVSGTINQPAYEYLIVTSSSAPRSFEIQRTEIQGNPPNAISPAGWLLFSFVQATIYTFRAERLRVGASIMGSSVDLQPDASNLPQVLNQLQTRNPTRYERLLRHVRAVFPHITQITARPTSEREALIEVWDVPPESERSDLAVSLLESGTGIGQVLAMLYVVVTADAPKIIVIDEPHSFLHPGAVRRLFGILSEYPQHQYILTTHSPAAIAAVTPASLKLVQRTETGSTVTAITAQRRGDLVEFLEEVGAKLSDVFGPDRILWVEGKTEERAFPILLEAFGPRHLVGLDVLAVHETGDLTNKQAKRVLRIYERLLASVSLIPPAAAFVFDREGRSEREMRELEAVGRGLVRFLPRRMYENYLLDSAAIAEAISSDDTERRQPLSAADVSDWLVRNSARPEFWFAGEAPVAFGENQWARQINGSAIMERLFTELSETRVAYDKVRHGVAITRTLLSQGDAGLQELARDFLLRVLE